MSATFPTLKQFVGIQRSELNAEYPDGYREDRGAFEDTLKMRTTETAWMAIWVAAIDAGRKPELSALDTLTEDQLYNLRKHYAPVGSLDWYIPVRFRIRN